MLGLLTAVLIGLAIYRGVVHLNLSVFFRFTGAALIIIIIIAAGVLGYGVHDLQGAGILPGLNTLAWDIEGYRVTAWYGTLIKGIFNLGPRMTALEVLTDVGYLVPTMFLFWRPVGPVEVAAPKATATDVSEVTMVSARSSAVSETSA